MGEPESDTEALREEVKRLRKALSGAAAGLETMLRLRGFRVHSKEPAEDLLVPGPPFTDDFYRMMGRYSFRLFLRDAIKRQQGFGEKDVARYATEEVTRDYIRFLVEAGVAEPRGNGYRLRKRIKSFGETLEWFLAEIFRREFMTEAFWGVKFRGQRVGGDYDLIARVDGDMLYMEIKSSPPKQIYGTEVAAFLDRVEDIRPAAAVFFVDTELRMKDKVVPMFEDELRRRPGPLPSISRMEKELFQIEDRIFIINAKDSVAGNLEKVLAWHFRARDLRRHDGRH
jgi:hypothetical protein